MPEKLHKVKVGKWERQERVFGHMLNEIVTAYNQALKAKDVEEALGTVRAGIIKGGEAIWAEKELEGQV